MHFNLHDGRYLTHDFYLILFTGKNPTQFLTKDVAHCKNNKSKNKNHATISSVELIFGHFLRIAAY